MYNANLAIIKNEEASGRQHLLGCFFFFLPSPPALIIRNRKLNCYGLSEYLNLYVIIQNSGSTF